MDPWSYNFAGRLDERVLRSAMHLVGNPLGDPHERPLWVYVPPGYDRDPGRRFPSVYVLQGYTGHVAMWRNRAPFRRPFPEVADDLIARGGVHALHHRLRRRLDRLRRLRVRRLSRHRSLYTYLCDELCPSSTPTTGRCPTPSIEAWQASRAAASGQ